MKRSGSISSCVLLAGFVAFSAGAQTSPFNGKKVVPADSTGHYRLVIGGHFHGSSQGRSGFPAGTLLAGIDTINALNANVLLSTGDLFLSADKDSAHYADSFFMKIDAALFNAPGNHDVEGSVYLNSYGPTFSSFDIGADRVILFDTERDNGNIAGDQLDLLRQQINGFHGNFLFIVSHRPVWAEDIERYQALFTGNTRSALGNNYTKEVFPIVEQIAEHAQVFWISGSMAGMAPASIFFQEHAPGISYIQCALRDEPRDALLLADVKNDKVEWKGISLTGQTLSAPPTYDAEYWETHQSKLPKLNWRLIPYLIRRAISGPEFWFGAIIALICAWVVRRLLIRGF